MPSSGMLHRVALVRTDVSEKLSASFIKVTRIGEVGTLAVTGNRRTLRLLRSVRRLPVTANVPSSRILFTLMVEGIRSSETSVLKRATLMLSLVFVVPGTYLLNSCCATIVEIDRDTD
jgi:hypothetical protein